jgi:hypothetical protein
VERLDTQRLPTMDAWMDTRYQLFPKLIYGAAAVTHSPQKLEDAFESTCWYKLLPSLHVNRNIMKEYRMLLLWFQGLALPKPNIDALSKKIHLMCYFSGDYFFQTLPTRKKDQWPYFLVLFLCPNNAILPNFDTRADYEKQLMSN